MSDRIIAWDQNPDPMFSECRVNNIIEPGVEFTTVEPLAGGVMFVGQSAIYEAVGILNGLTINEVLRCLDDGNQAQQKKLQRERDRADKAEAELRELRDAVLALGGVNGSD